MLVRLDGNDIQMMVRENSEREEIRRLFDKDRVARLGEETAQQIQSVRDACGDEQVFKVHRSAVPSAEKIRQRRAEVPISLLRAVLQKGIIILRQNLLRRFADQIERQEQKRRVAQAEINDICGYLRLDDGKGIHRRKYNRANAILNLDDVTYVTLVVESKGNT